MSAHIADRAALYALGTIDDRERAEIDSHVPHCEACAQSLAQAYDDVAALAQAQRQHARPAALDARIAAIFAPPPIKRTWSARVTASALVAALLLIAVLPSAVLISQNRAMHATELAETQLMARMTSAPHRMASFSAMGSADARVVYGLDGSWYGVIVRGVTRPLDLIWMHDGRKTSLGTVEQHGDIAMIYLPNSHRMDQLALSDGQRVVAKANLAFQPNSPP